MLHRAIRGARSCRLISATTPGEYAIAATGDIGAVTIGGDMTGYAIAAGLDAAADSANDNGRIAEVIVKGQYSNSSIVAGVQSDTNSSSTTPYTWGSLSDNARGLVGRRDSDQPPRRNRLSAPRPSPAA